MINTRHDSSSEADIHLKAGVSFDPVVVRMNEWIIK